MASAEMTRNPGCLMLGFLTRARSGQESVLDDRADIYPGPCCDGPLDKRGRSFVQQLLGFDPRTATYVDDIFRLEAEIAQVSIERAIRIDDKGFRLVEGTANHQHAAFEGAIGEPAAIGNGGNHGGAFHKPERARGHDLTHYVNIARRG